MVFNQEPSCFGFQSRSLGQHKNNNAAAIFNLFRFGDNFSFPNAVFISGLRSGPTKGKAKLKFKQFDEFG